MRGHPDLDGPRPLVHHLVDADLEELVVPQRPGAQYHPVVEVIRRAGDGDTASPRPGCVVSAGTGGHHISRDAGDGSITSTGTPGTGTQGHNVNGDARDGDTRTQRQRGRQGWVHHINRDARDEDTRTQRQRGHQGRGHKDTRSTGTPGMVTQGHNVNGDARDGSVMLRGTPRMGPSHEQGHQR